MNLTDTAYIVFWEIPSPRRDGIPLLDLDLHRRILLLQSESVRGCWSFELLGVRMGALYYQSRCWHNVCCFIVLQHLTVRVRR